MNQLIAEHPLFCFAVVLVAFVCLMQIVIAYIDRNKPILKCRNCNHCDDDHLFDDEEDQQLDEDE